MKMFIYLLIASGMAIFVGTMIMYYLESWSKENSKMKTVLDALWWCIATVCTVVGLEQSLQLLSFIPRVPMENGPIVITFFK